MLIEIDAAILVALPLVVRDVGADALDGLEHVVANIGVQFSTALEDRESSLVLEVLGVPGFGDATSILDSPLPPVTVPDTTDPPAIADPDPLVSGSPLPPVTGSPPTIVDTRPLCC